MSTEPVIYTKNYVMSDDTFVCSHGSTYIARIYDRDRDSQYITSGANSDATEASVEVDFYEGGVAQTRTIDRCILVNHNLKDPTIEYWDGSAWQTFATGSGLATSSKIFTGTQRQTTKMRIRCSTTQTTNAEKAIGELIFCAVTLAFSQEIVNYQPGTRQEATEIKLADGSIHRTVVKATVNRSEKYEVRAQFNFLTTTELSTLRQLKESGAAFLWQPESVARVDEIYYVNWVGSLQWQYNSTYKSAGIRLDMQLKEI